MAQLEADVALLKASTATLLAKLDELTKQQERSWAISRVQARLQEIPDPAAHVQQQADQAALFLMQQAEVLWQKPAKRMIAISFYKQIIKLYPDSPSASKARIRLERARRRPSQENDKGADQWQEKEQHLS